jgi:hypothetical protein
MLRKLVLETYIFFFKKKIALWNLPTSYKRGGIFLTLGEKNCEIRKRRSVIT